MSTHKKTLPIPEPFASQREEKEHRSTLSAFKIQKRAEDWKRLHSLNPVGSDKVRTHLLVIDAQEDFSSSTGSLFVAGRSGYGAVKANNRLAFFILKNLNVLSRITCTMDTHLPYQIFFPSAHICEDGSHPEPNTIISADDYRRGRYRPNPAMATQLGVDPVWLQRQFTHYCEELERSGKYALFLWPYHCLLGTKGHQLAPIIEQSVLFHAFARGADNLPEIKGGNPLSERYSIFKEEVTSCFDGRPIPGAQKNTRLIQALLESDVVIMAGLASSHCVKESINDLLDDIQSINEALTGKVYILRDCTAAVVIPGGADFTDEAEAAFQRFADAGMHIVDSSHPIETWPDIRL